MEKLRAKVGVGIMGAKARGSSPVYIEIRLGIRQSKNADSIPITATEIKSRALTIDPVINWCPKYGATTAIATKILTCRDFATTLLQFIDIILSCSIFLIIYFFI